MGLVGRSVSLIIFLSLLGATRGAFAASCPKSGAEVQSWREGLLGKLDSDYGRGYGKKVIAEIRKCEAEASGLFNSEDVSGCMATFKNFLSEVSDERLIPAKKTAIPYDEQPDVRANQVPDDLQDPEFLRLVSDRKTIPEAKKFIDRLNAKKPPAASCSLPPARAFRMPCRFVIAMI